MSKTLSKIETYLHTDKTVLSALRQSLNCMQCHDKSGVCKEPEKLYKTFRLPLEIITNILKIIGGK